MVRKVYYTDEQVDSCIHDIIRQMIKDKWIPDYVVGLSRGGLIPAIKISHYFSIPMETLKVSLRNGNITESNCWMAEDAFGYIHSDERVKYGNARWDIGKRSKILIIDDINDSGATFNWIKKDWQNSCLPQETDAWEKVWGANVRFAALVENAASEFETNYATEIIDKSEDDVWCIFPWENWWKSAL